MWPDKVGMQHDEAERFVCKAAVRRKDGVRAEAVSLPKGRHGDEPKRLVVRVVGRVAKVGPPLDDAVARHRGLDEAREVAVEVDRAIGAALEDKRPNFDLVAAVERSAGDAGR